MWMIRVLLWTTSRAGSFTTLARLGFLDCVELSRNLWSHLLHENVDDERYMYEFLRDMAAVALGVIIGGLVLLAVYDYYHSVYLASAAIGA